MSHNSWSKKIPSQHFLPNRQQPKLWKIELGYIHNFFFFHEILLHAKLSLIKNFWVNMSTSFGDRLIVLKKIDWKFKCCYLIGWIQIWINFFEEQLLKKGIDYLSQKLFRDILFRFFVSLMYIVGKIAEKVTKRSCDQFEVTAKLAIGSKKQLVLIRKYQTGQVKVRSLNVFFSSMLLQIIIYWKVNYWGQAW